MESHLFLAELFLAYEPVRSAGFSPQGRPWPDRRSCGLKSALLGRFMGSEIGSAARRGSVEISGVAGS